MDVKSGKEADVAIQEPRLTNETLNVLKSGHFSEKLLPEVICHNDFSRLTTDCFTKPLN